MVELGLQVLKLRSDLAFVVVELSPEGSGLFSEEVGVVLDTLEQLSLGVKVFGQVFSDRGCVHAPVEQFEPGTEHVRLQHADVVGPVLAEAVFLARDDKVATLRGAHRVEHRLSGALLAEGIAVGVVRKYSHLRFCPLHVGQIMRIVRLQKELSLFGLLLDDPYKDLQVNLLWDH